jgi:YVTN family beta-propeller protein
MKTIHSTLLILTLLTACTAGTGTGSPPQLNNGVSPSPSAAPMTGASLKSLATIPVGKGPHGITVTQGFVYVANTSGGSISVIDTATDKVVTDLPVGGAPSYTRTSPDGKFAVNIDGSGKVRIIDPTGGKHATVRTLDPGQGPDKVHFNADGTQMAVSLTNEPAVTVYSFAGGLTGGLTTNRYNVGSVADATYKHRDVAFEDGILLVPNTKENNVSLIDTRTSSVRAITAGNSPSVVDLANPGTGLMGIIGNAASNTISFLTIADTTVTTIAGGNTPTDCVVRADGKVAFITNAGSNDVSVVDLATRKELGRVPTGKRPVHIYQAPPVGMAVKHSEGNGNIWVLNDDGDSVTILDPMTFIVKATVAVGKGHHKAAFTATKAYVTNITSNDVSVIDLTAIK